MASSRAITRRSRAASAAALVASFIASLLVAVFGGSAHADDGPSRTPSPYSPRLFAAAVGQRNETQLRTMYADLVNANRITEPSVGLVARDATDNLDVRTHVYRWDRRSPSEILRTGFAPRAIQPGQDLDSYSNLNRYVHEMGAPGQSDRSFSSIFVGATQSSRWYPASTSAAGVSERWYRYEIFAPGGFDVARSLGSLYGGYAGQEEVVFAGGISARHIRNVQAYEITREGRYSQARPLEESFDGTTRVHRIMRNAGFDPNSASVDAAHPAVDVQTLRNVVCPTAPRHLVVSLIGINARVNWPGGQVHSNPHSELKRNAPEPDGACSDEIIDDIVTPVHPNETTRFYVLDSAKIAEAKLPSQAASIKGLTYTESPFPLAKSENGAHVIGTPSFCSVTFPGADRIEPSCSNNDYFGQYVVKVSGAWPTEFHGNSNFHSGKFSYYSEPFSVGSDGKSNSIYLKDIKLSPSVDQATNLWQVTHSSEEFFTESEDSTTDIQLIPVAEVADGNNLKEVGKACDDGTTTQDKDKKAFVRGCVRFYNDDKGSLYGLPYLAADYWSKSLGLFWVRDTDRAETRFNCSIAENYNSAPLLYDDGTMRREGTGEVQMSCQSYAFPLKLERGKSYNMSYYGTRVEVPRDNTGLHLYGMRIGSEAVPKTLKFTAPQSS